MASFCSIRQKQLAKQAERAKAVEAKKQERLKRQALKEEEDRRKAEEEKARQEREAAEAKQRRLEELANKCVSPFIHIFVGHIIDRNMKVKRMMYTQM